MINVNKLLSDGLKNIFDVSNQIVQIKLFTSTFNTGSYDDEQLHTIAGSSYTSGLLFPMGGKQGSIEAMMMEQGKLLTQDKILYITGSQNYNGWTLVGIGSPTPAEYYTLIPDGIKIYTINGSIIYNKLWLRHTITGSLFV